MNDPTDIANISQTLESVGGVSVHTFLSLDNAGLGDILIRVTNTSSAVQTDTVTAWLYFNFWDDASQSNYTTGLVAGTGNDAMLSPEENWQISQADDVTKTLNNTSDETTLNGQPNPSGTYTPNTTGDAQNYCCDPYLGLSYTGVLQPGQTKTYAFETRWIPTTAYDQALYAGDIGVASQLLAPGTAFYLTEQELGNPDLGTLEFYMPEPGTWMLVIGGVLVIFATRIRHHE